MLHPDNISKRYAGIIPQLHALGYTCTLKGSDSDQVCIMRIGRHEVEHHLRHRDLRALAQDALNAQGIAVTGVRAIRILVDGSMEADVFLHTGRPQTMSIEKNWDATCRQWRADLIH